jgi:hypothetical protein
MGANIAGDIGREQLSEAVTGYSNPEHAKVWKERCAVAAVQHSLYMLL